MCTPNLYVYISNPKKNRLPDNVSLEEGALIEPLSVGIHAARRGEVKLGDRVFVFGAGPVGLLTAAAAKAAGASHVTMADISESRLEFAKSYIADETIHMSSKPPKGVDTNEFAKEEVEKLFQSGLIPANIVFDCTGVETCVQMSVYVRNNHLTISAKISHLNVIIYVACQE